VTAGKTHKPYQAGVNPPEADKARRCNALVSFKSVYMGTVTG